MSLTACDLSFSYSSKPVFSHVSLTIDHGERVALSAPSGAGKTTLCRVLAGYLPAATGSIKIDGAPFDPRDRGPRSVQLLWQHPEQAFDPRLRMRRSLAEAGEADAPRMRMLRRRFGIRDEWLERLPHELSGGELMRLSMVRALMARPRYLIADEATAMLDVITQAGLWGQMLELMHEEGFGMLVVSHSPALVKRICTRIVEFEALSTAV